jgi:hypothetical protein
MISKKIVVLMIALSLFLLVASIWMGSDSNVSENIGAGSDIGASIGLKINSPAEVDEGTVAGVEIKTGGYDG